MNRTTAILVALGALLGHVLAINQTTDGGFAPPHDLAHVAYRVSRNLVYHGTAAWNVGSPVAEAYPSFLWVGVCSVLTRLYLPITTATQVIGIASVLGTVVVLAQFSTDRLAGLIALLLLVASGTTAAAAGAGTELPLVMFLVTCAFLAFERRMPRAFAVAASLVAAARPDCWILIASLGAAELLLRRHRDGRNVRSLLPSFAAPAATALGVILLRRWIYGTWLSPFGALVLELDPERYRLGLDYVVGFYLRSGAAALVVFPLVYLVTGRLTPTGRRALGLAGAWTALMVVVGGSGEPFWIAMAPVVPLIFLSVQEAMTRAMDSRRTGLAAVTWVLFVCGMVASGLVSRVPADLGGLPLERLQRTWMTPSTRLERSYGRPLGREGLMQEIREVDRLRALAIFVRDSLDPSASLLTPWPGTIGYIAKDLEVVDLLGRVTPPPRTERTQAWYGLQRVDLARALGGDHDYITPTEFRGANPPRFLRDILPVWFERYDDRGADDLRQRVTLNELRLRYELVAVPVPDRGNDPEVLSPRPHYLMRSRDLELAPGLTLRREGDEVVVLVSHEGHEQVVDLEVRLEGADGDVAWMRPTGETVDTHVVHARTDVLLFRTGQRRVRLMSFPVPAGFTGTVHASLWNPSNEPASPLNEHRRKSLAIR